jgi:hypothetical protein
MAETVLMKSPTGEICEVEATATTLTPLMAKGWHQAPAGSVATEPVLQAPANQPAAPAEEKTA